MCVFVHVYMCESINMFVCLYICVFMCICAYVWNAHVYLNVEPKVSVKCLLWSCFCLRCLLFSFVYVFDCLRQRISLNKKLIYSARKVGA